MPSRRTPGSLDSQRTSARGGAVFALEPLGPWPFGALGPPCASPALLSTGGSALLPLLAVMVPEDRFQRREQRDDDPLRAYGHLGRALHPVEVRQAVVVDHELAVGQVTFHQDEGALGRE